MNNTLEIIPCDFDLTEHCEALVALMNEYITDKMGDGIPYTEEQRIKLVEGLKNHPSRLVLFAMAGSRFVGLTTCFLNFATFTVKPYVNIHDVIVTAAWRNRGVGRRMLEKVIEEAEAMGCSKVTLEVREDNHNARHLYNSLGFQDADPKVFYWTRYL
jgi:ribosomal protein S18 acetylase RimI-like enzyme